MNSELPPTPGFWRTFRLLLGAARRRSSGRRSRQKQLLNQRSATNWGGFGFAMAVLFMAVLNVFAAFVLRLAVESGERADAESHGKIAVSSTFLDAAKKINPPDDDSSGITGRDLTDYEYSWEAKSIAKNHGGRVEAIEAKLRNAVRRHGAQDFITNGDASPGLSFLVKAGPLSALAGSVALLWWGVMLVFQGEGLELDLQRRRHPMWEWLFSHPVPAGAVFLAEMFSPLAANPMYWAAPLFVGVVYSFVYDTGVAVLAVLVIGIPVTVAAACMGKALEIGVVLRFSPRSRGAIVGLMGWLGYASMILFFLGMVVVPRIVSAMSPLLGIPAALPWPWLRLFLGAQADGSFSFIHGMAP
jgi:hypothetical protein